MLSKSASLLLPFAAGMAAAVTTLPAMPAPDYATHTGFWPANPDVTIQGPVVKVTSTAPAATTLSGVPPYTYTRNPYPFAQSPSASSKTTSSSKAKPTLPACKPVQYNFPAGQGSNPARAAAVKSAYVYAWNAYIKYASGYDELLPLSAAGINDWYGWGVTVVDGIDTAIVMNLTSIVAQQLEIISKIDFSTTPYGPVEIFDTSIRYVGGLISAYDMLKSGQFPNTYNQDHVNALLKQAVVLADKIAFGFNTPSGLAATYVNFDTDTPVEATYTINNVTYEATNTASAGTFILDWFRLSDLTGNNTYRTLAARGESYLVNPNPQPVYPGLVGTEFNVQNGQMLTFDGGWQAGVDSFHEYLIKTYQYENTKVTTQYKDFWLQSVDSTLGHLALVPYGFQNAPFVFLSELDVNGSLEYFQDDFSCFAGGNFFLGGALLGNEAITELGVRTTLGCYQTYKTTLTGLGPIAWGWYNGSNLAYNPQDNNDAAERKMATKSGYFIPNGDENWEFRPEEIESIFYGHRITGQSQWADYNWAIFQAINATSRNNIAFATVNQVNTPNGGTQNDNLDSFFFAEVLKYLYLTFSDPNVINLNQWVINTEAHPFLVQCGIGNIDDSPGPHATGI